MKFIALILTALMAVPAFAQTASSIHCDIQDPDQGPLIFDFALQPDESAKVKFTVTTEDGTQVLDLPSQYQGVQGQDKVYDVGFFMGVLSFHFPLELFNSVSLMNIKVVSTSEDSTTDGVATCHSQF